MPEKCEESSYTELSQNLDFHNIGNLFPCKNWKKKDVWKN